MKKESFQGILLGIVIMCAVFAFITVAWAAFSSTLTISGTATVKAQSWKVEFSDTSSAVLAASSVTGTVTPSASTDVLPTTAPSLTTSVFGSSSTNLANFSNPGEEIVYSWYVVNDGTFDAKIKTITGILSTVNATTGSNVDITCSSSATFTSDASVTSISDWCAKYVKAELQVNNVVVTTDSSNNLTSAATTVSAKSGSTLGSVPVSLTLKYLDVSNNADLPNDDVTITLPGTSGIVMTFEQDTTGA